MGVGCWREWGKRGKGRWGVDVVEGGRWEREEGVQKEKGKQSCKLAEEVASATRFATLAPPEPRPPKPARRSDPGTRGRYEAGLEAWGSHAGPESFTVKQHAKGTLHRQQQKRAPPAGMRSKCDARTARWRATWGAWWRTTHSEDGRQKRGERGDRVLTSFF